MVTIPDRIQLQIPLVKQHSGVEGVGRCDSRGDCIFTVGDLTCIDQCLQLARDSGRNFLLHMHTSYMNMYILSYTYQCMYESLDTLRYAHVNYTAIVYQ